VKKLGILFVAIFAGVLAANAAFAGNLVINGSTTVLPISQSAAEAFMAENKYVKISVSGGGSGNGIKAIIDGTCDIANSSRFMKDAEVKSAVEKGVFPVPFAVAIDAIVPIVHPSNPIANLTTSQLQDIYTGRVTSWKQVGGEDKPIVVVGRDTSSGTYEVWEEKILKKEKVTPKAQVVASSGALLQTVGKNKYAIGYDGIGYADDKSVKMLTVNGVKADAKTARSGKYAVSRYLFVFTKGWPKDDVLDFVNFMQGDEGQKIVVKQGFVPLR
jgi:phosphate transport system substrate-binding protein